jgi:hypothetical protein
MVTTLTQVVEQQNEKIDWLITENERNRNESESSIIKRSYDDMAAHDNNELMIQEEDTQTITSVQVCSPWTRLRDDLTGCKLENLIEMWYDRQATKSFQLFDDRNTSTHKTKKSRLQATITKLLSFCTIDSTIEDRPTDPNTLEIWQTKLKIISDNCYENALERFGACKLSMSSQTAFNAGYKKVITNKIIQC